MICRSCGAFIKHNDEYCRKCGALVINFNKVENKDLKDICIENNLRGKFQNIINKISKKEDKLHKVNGINKHSGSLNDLGNLVNKYSKAIEDILSNEKLNLHEDKNNNMDLENIIDSISKKFKT